MSVQSDSDPSASGGWGEGSPSMPLRDVRLAELALREMWPIPPEVRPKVIDRLLAVIDGPDSSDRAVTAASKALISASKLNLDALRSSMQAEEFEQLKQRLDELEKRFQR